MKSNGPHNLSPDECDKLAKARGLFIRAILPNQDGYKFFGFGADGWRYRCAVKKNEEGIHQIRGEAWFNEIVGWRPIKEQESREETTTSFDQHMQLILRGQRAK